VNLSTHIQDIVGLCESEKLTEVILVGQHPLTRSLGLFRGKGPFLEMFEMVEKFGVIPDRFQDQGLFFAVFHERHFQIDLPANAERRVLCAAAVTAVRDLEQISMNRFQDAGTGQDQGPGLGIAEHLPAEFRAISRRFREAANQFGELARRMPDTPSSEQHRALVAALSKVTNQCRICHDSYGIE